MPPSGCACLVKFCTASGEPQAGHYNRVDVYAKHGSVNDGCGELFAATAVALQCYRCRLVPATIQNIILYAIYQWYCSCGACMCTDNYVVNAQKFGTVEVPVLNSVKWTIMAPQTVWLHTVLIHSHCDQVYRLPLWLTWYVVGTEPSTCSLPRGHLQHCASDWLAVRQPRPCYRHASDGGVQHATSHKVMLRQSLPSS